MFHFQIEKEQSSSTVTKLHSVHTDVFNYQPKIYDWVSSIENPKSRCFEKD